LIELDGEIMDARICLSLLVMGLASIPGDTSQTWHQRYGQPISETYIVKPGVVASVQYGPSGRACSIVIKPQHALLPLKRRKNNVGNFSQVFSILEELVPERERGKRLTPTSLHLACVGQDAGEMDCSGVREDWERLLIYRMGGDSVQHYATIHWKRDECRDIDTDQD
jgi:hypothetical protein